MVFILFLFPTPSILFRDGISLFLVYTKLLPPPPPPYPYSTLGIPKKAVDVNKKP